jgi:demethylspheroidene O-methyltransferase
VQPPLWRDRWLGAQRFQWWAARLPGVRRIARHHAERLFDLCSGFVASQVLYACVRSGLIEELRAGARPASQLAERCRLDGEGMGLLLDSAQELGLVERRDAGWGLGILGAALAGNSAVLRMIEHQPQLYADLVDPLQRLRSGAPPGALAQFWSYAQRPPEEAVGAVGPYTKLMAATQALVTEDVLHAYPFGRHRVVLDVGGGDGTFLCALAQRWPQLALRLFDLPEVARLAETRLAAAGLAARTRVTGGDFRADALPTGADVITLVRVLHDHDDAPALALLQAARRALPAGGRLVIAEPMRAVRGSFVSATLYLRFYLRAMGQGRMRSPAEITALLRASGFRRVRRHRTLRPWQCALLSAAA